MNLRKLYVVFPRKLPISQQPKFLFYHKLCIKVQIEINNNQFMVAVLRHFHSIFMLKLM